MADLVISGPIAERLKQMAEKEHKPVEVVLEKMMAQYTPEVSEQSELVASFDFNGDYQMWSPQTDEESIATMYEVLEDYKRKKNAK